jgi:hypothetical protein
LDKKAQQLAVARDWEDAHTVGRFVFPIDMIEQPREDIRARGLDLEHVDTLTANFKATRTASQDVKVAMFSDNKYQRLGNRVNEGFPPELFAELKAKGSMAVSGAHSSAAVSKLHAKYVNNPLWKFLQADLIVCQDIALNREMLKSIGLMANATGEVRLMMTWWNKCQALHDDFIQVYATKDQHTLTPSQRIAELKKMRCAIWGENTNSIGAMTSVAKKTGKLWEAIVKVFEGDVAPKKKSTFVKAKSGYPFTWISNIDDDVLVEMLEEVLACKHDMKWFGTECKNLKARGRITDLILNARIAQGAPDDEQKEFKAAMESWGSASSSKYMCAQFDDEFVEGWVPLVLNLKAKAQLPEELVDRVQKMMADDIERKSLERVSQIFDHDL